MSDPRPTPEDADRTVAEPAEQPAAPPPPPAAEPVYAQQAAPPREARWWSRRAPLLAIAAALVFGCLVGGGIVAVAAFVFGDHGGHSRPDMRQFDRDRPGFGQMPRRDRGGPPNWPVPAPATPGAPAPTATS